MNWLIQHLFGLGKLEFLSGMDKDKLATYIGFGQGLLAAAMTYVATGFDPTNPVSWFGLGYALFTYGKGWATNKA